MRILPRRRPLALTCLASSLALALAACAASPDPPEGAPSASAGASSLPVTVTVDRASYAPGSTIGLRIANGSDATYGYHPCTRTLEREQGGAWTAVSEPVRVCTRELRILAGRETVSTTTELPRSLPSGRYRLVLSFSHEGADAAPSGGALLVGSNAFRVE